MRKLLRGAAIAAFGLFGVYVVAANLFLNAGLASRAINRRPEKFQLRWSSAWTLWPGRVILLGVETRGSSSRMDWYASLDSVSASFRILPLFHRTASLKAVGAEGVVYRQRRKPLPGATHRVPPDELPPIPELLDTPDARKKSRPAGAVRGHPWTILAEGITCDVRELWFDRFRLTGPMRVETPMSLVVHGSMEFPRVRIRMESGELRAGKETIFGDLGITVDATIDPYVPRNARGLRFFGNLSGRFDLRSDSASLFFLEAYFRKTPWVRFNNRAAARMVLFLDHGRLRPGTLLDVANDRADIEIIDRRIRGTGRITARVQDVGGTDQSTLVARMTEFQISPLDRDEPFARGHDMTIAATSRSLDLSNPFTDLHVVLDQPGAEILDLGFYNSLIPAGSEFRLLSGTGTLKYHLEGSHEDRSLHGEIDLTVKNARAVFKNYPLHGGFVLNTRLRQASPRELRFDISGTRLELHAYRFNWSAVFTLPKAVMVSSNPVRIDAAIRLAMMDTRPLVALFDALKGVSDRMKRMMTIEDISGGATLGVRKDRVEIDDLDITGQGLRALAELTIGKNSREGILYVKFHGIPLGIRLTPDGKDLKIIRPHHWFQEERARRRRERRASPD